VSEERGEAWRQLVGAAKTVDWLRVVNRGTTLIRAFKGDARVADDTALEQARAGKFQSFARGVVRVAVGCVASTGRACDCPMCQEDAEV